jgi:hypothetical protein
MIHIFPGKQDQRPTDHAALYHKLLHYIEQFHPQKKLVLCPFDNTVIPLMTSYFGHKSIAN